MTTLELVPSFCHSITFLPQFQQFTPFLRDILSLTHSACGHHHTTHSVAPTSPCSQDIPTISPDAYSSSFPLLCLAQQRNHRLDCGPARNGNVFIIPRRDISLIEKGLRCQTRLANSSANDGLCCLCRARCRTHQLNLKGFETRKWLSSRFTLKLTVGPPPQPSAQPSARPAPQTQQ